MIYVIATLTIRPGALEPLVEAAVPCIENSRREPGCRLYDLHASLTDPERVVFIEQWETHEALAAHALTSHHKAWLEASHPHVTGSSIEIVYPDRVERL